MYKCEICGREFETLCDLEVHNGKSHKQIIIKEIKCELCGKKFETLRGLSAHIGQIHNNEIMIVEYYIKFIGEKGKCHECGKNTSFRSLKDGYLKFCSLKCSNNSIEVQNKKKETCMKNSGYTHPMKDPETREKHMNTCFENSGYLNPAQNPITRKKQKQTYFEKTGYEIPMQNPETKKKKKETYFEKTGYDHQMHNPESIKKLNESILKNNNGRHPSKLTYQQCQERYPDVVKIEELKEGPNGEIWGHCKNSSCKNSKENGGYFELTPAQINGRNIGINIHDTAHFYCCEECKHSCPLYHRSASALHNLLNENKEILYTSEEYSTWRHEVFQRQLREDPEHTINYCEYCHAIEDLHVHHIHSQKLEPGYALDPDNGMVVCEKCHYEKCHEKGTDCSTGNLANKICK
jgi:hypothetical protein